MATPKFKKSRANTHSRRSQWKADNVALQEVTIDGQTVRIPRRLVKAAKLGLIDVEQFQGIKSLSKVLSLLREQHPRIIHSS